MSYLPARPDHDGDQHLRLLQDAWDQTEPHWRDGLARQFVTRQWTPLRDESRSYLVSLAAMLDLLEEAERDTDF